MRSIWTGVLLACAWVPVNLFIRGFAYTTYLVYSFLDDWVNNKMSFGNFNVLLEMQKRQFKFGKLFLGDRYS